MSRGKQRARFPTALMKDMKVAVAWKPRCIIFQVLEFCVFPFYINKDIIKKEAQIGAEK